MTISISLPIIRQGMIVETLSNIDLARSQMNIIFSECPVLCPNCCTQSFKKAAFARVVCSEDNCHPVEFEINKCQPPEVGNAHGSVCEAGWRACLAIE